MKTIGLIGGTGWVSTAAYYSLLNEKVNQRLGGMQFARCIIYSVNFGELMELKGDAEAMTAYLRKTAEQLVGAGAECLMLGANTLHMFADQLASTLPVPLIHIARATAAAIRQKGMQKVGLLGTRQTMEKHFYKSILKKEGIEVLIPGEEEREMIDQAILGEFFKEVFSDATRKKFLDVIENLKIRGAEGIVLGCTEIPLLLKQEHCDLPLFNTTELHVEAAVDFALGS
ncbi:MAG: amino acid racemase [Bacteroidetes bacterium]|nr:amino acid racemase [Bacteroidota bacterium]